MASRSLGTLTLDLIANIGGYTRGLDSAEREAKKRAKAIEKAFDDAAKGIGVALGAATAGFVAGFAALDQAVKYVADFQDLADMTGASAEGLASFAVAAGTAGVSMESIASASTKLTKGLTGVDDESKAAGAALEFLGLNIEEFKNLSPEDQLEEIAKAMGNVKSSTDQVALAMDLFGKSGAEVLKFLKALDEQGGRTVILTKEMIKQADDYADAQSKAAAELKIYAGYIATLALPAITDLMKAFSDVARDIVSADKAAKDLKQSGTIESWADNAVTAVAFVGDAFNGLRTIVSRTGEFLGATAAALVERARGNEAGVKAIQDAYNESLNTSQFKSIREAYEKARKERQAMERLAGQENRGFTPTIPGRTYGGRTTGGSGGGGRGRSSATEKDPFAQAQRYLESLQKQLEKTQDLTVAEQALLDIQAGRLGKVSEAQQAAILDTARQIDAAKALEEQEKANNKAIEEQLRLREQLVQEGERFTEQFLTPQEQYAKSIENVNRLLDEGVISVETATRAVQSYRKELEESNKTVEEFDEFTKNAIKGSQDAIAGFLENLASGSKKSFKEIADDFANMLVKLAAQSLAADLTKKLFGSAGGGEGGGWLSGLLSLFGGARAAGGPVLPNSLYMVNERGPEVFQAANGSQYLMTGTDSGRVIPNAGGGSVINVMVPGNVSQRTANQIADRISLTQRQARRYS